MEVQDCTIIINQARKYLKKGLKFERHLDLIKVGSVNII